MCLHDSSLCGLYNGPHEDGAVSGGTVSPSVPQPESGRSEGTG